MNQKELKNILDYSPETGNFYWKINKGRKRVGDPAGCLDKRFGYVLIKINQKIYLAHRLVYLFMTGSIPDNIDHSDRNPSNNIWTNLRKTTLSENQYNKKIASNNTSGVKGVSWHKKSQKWRAQIAVEKTVRYLGYFNTIEEASNVIKEARKKYHGEFAHD